MSEQRARISIDLPLHKKADAAWNALAASNDPSDPRIMVRGSALVRMAERGELEDLSVDSTRDEISRSAQFEKTNSKGEPSPVDPPRDVAGVILHRDSAQYTNVPRVDRVVDVPVISSRGKLIDTPGCHPDDELYYWPHINNSHLKIKDANSTEDIEWALNLLMDDLLGDFLFDDEASRAHALALLLLPFVRDYIRGPTPLHVVLAPDYGAGKTLLSQASLSPGCGIVPATPQTNNEEEWRKRITTSLLSGSNAVLLDNLSGTLDSGALASALTTGVWRDRILGESREVSLTIRNAWVATGNNFDLSPEQIRRSIPIFLDPGEVRPADRNRGAFKHPDLLNWSIENRADLASAALTLITHWLKGPVGMVQGGYLYQRTGEDPRGSSQTLGSYEQWASVVGGVLEAAGVEGFLENRSRLKVESDPESQEIMEFLEAWYNTIDAPISSRDLAKECQFGAPLHDSLPSEMAVFSGSSSFFSRVTAWLRKNNRRWIGEYQLMAQEGRRRTWIVRKKET